MASSIPVPLQLEVQPCSQEPRGDGPKQYLLLTSSVHLKEIYGRRMAELLPDTLWVFISKSHCVSFCGGRNSLLSPGYLYHIGRPITPHCRSTLQNLDAPGLFVAPVVAAHLGFEITDNSAVVSSRAVLNDGRQSASCRTPSCPRSLSL